MFGLSKAERERKKQKEFEKFDQGLYRGKGIAPKEAKEFEAEQEKIRKGLEMMKKSNDSTIRCPDCYTWFEANKIFCTGCGRAIGKEGFNALPSGEQFYFCVQCNTRFSTHQEYIDHHYKHG